MSSPRVAIVQDWMVGGGAERVVEALHELYPDAPIYTSYCSKKWREKLDDKVITGYLQSWPFSKLRRMLPVLRVWWFRSLDLSDFDIVISSTGNGEAKHIRTGANTVHVSYCHTPVHFYWSKYDQYLANPSVHPKWLGRIGLKLLAGPLRRADYKAAQNVDHFIANSTHIQAAIKKYYDRESVVIFPPVNVDRFVGSENQDRAGFLVVGRQVPDKHIELAILACTQLNLSLTVIGDGPEHAQLVKLAGPTITFLTDASDEVVTTHFQRAEGFIFPSLDDFGITPVEALAAGTPVIAFKAGGALDYVDEQTGAFFEKQTVRSLKECLAIFNPKAFNPKQLHDTARNFSTQQFKKRMTTYLQGLNK